MNYPATPPLLVVGVGASAGGIEAMLPMFSRMPSTGRMVFVVAQHMAKDGHDELVARLIGRESALPVVLAQAETRLRPDTVYVIPSGRDGRVSGDILSLSPPAEEHISTPSVNALFASLAESAHGKAIGILLSGTGSDGTLGCRSIKAQGGLTMVQDPQEAKFNGMPTAAIDAKVVDKILPVGEISETLGRLFPGTHPASRRQSEAITGVASDMMGDGSAESRELAQLLRQIHQVTGIDFSSYKEDTLLRRMEKRKAMLGIASAEAYQAHIRQQPAELKQLQHLFLVSVSSFFRDAESFKVLKMSLAKLVAGKLAGEPVRVWVPGCASGEEVYTLAILIRELSDSHPAQITATDLNQDALAMCHEGVYRQTAFKEMDSALRDRYFLPAGQHFAVKPELKAGVIFEKRDVLRGVPPSNLDLVSCRNLLIYMKSELQDHLVKGFHQALRSQGLLFLGQSESLSFIGNSLFIPIDHYHRLFRRRH
jgi:chemotaxis methyl-accepting protein methylase